MKYRAILMDNDGTLMDFAAGERNAIRQVLRELGIDDPNAPDLYSMLNDRCWKDYEKGLITQPQLKIRRFRELLEHYGHPADPAVICRQYEDALALQSILLPGALEAVQKIAAHLPIVILTNGIARVQHSRLERSALAPYLSGLFISTEVGAPKPLPDMYLAALHALGDVPPENALMIGDSLTSDIAGACNAGVDACWYNPGRLPRPDSLAIRWEIHSIDQMPLVALS